MVHIHKYIAEVLERDCLKSKDLAKELNITPAMLGQYKLNRGYNPSLNVAKLVYKRDGVVLHPYSKGSIIWEIENEYTARVC